MGYFKAFYVMRTDENRLILRPYNSDFLLTTSFKRNGCVFTQGKVFRSLETFSFTYHMTISFHFWRETCSL